MKTLLATAATALVLSTAAFAESHTSAISSYELSDSDFYASDLLGMRVYATETDLGDTDMITAGAATEWDDIGEINDMIVSADGEIEAVIVGVGGFLGLGEKDVAVSMDALNVRTEEGDMGNRFLVINSSSAALEEAPAFEAMNREVADEMQEVEAEAETEMADADMPDADMPTDADMTTNRTMLTAPAMEREGYAAVGRDALTSEELTGMRIYGANDEDVGEIKDILMTDDGMVDMLILDIGGFIGLGEHQIAVTPDELTFMRSQDGEMNVYIDATQETLEAQPEYQS